MTANDILGKIYEAFDNDVAHEITVDAAELVVRSIVDCVETGKVVGHIDGIDLGIGIFSGDVVVNGEFTYFVGDGNELLQNRIRLLDRWQIDAVRTLVFS